MRKLVGVGIAAAVLGLASVASAEDAKLPVRYADRPLTLPKMTLAPEFSLPLVHVEGAGLAFNGVGLNLGAAFGVIDDLTVDVTPLSLLIGRTDVAGLFGGSQTKAYYGTFRLGATYRFLHTEVADIGARAEFGATGANDVIHLTGSIPVLLRLAHVVRIDTGFAFSGLFPTKSGAKVDGAMGSVGTSPTVLSAVGKAGIPVDVTVQIVDAFFAGLDTGFGIGSFHGKVDQSCFMPLGFRVGGTIGGDKPVVDLTGNFGFPFFLLGADSKPPFTNIWQVGLDARAYFQL